MTGPRILLLHEQAETRTLWAQRLLRAGFPAIEAAGSSTDLMSYPPDSFSLLVCGEFSLDTGRSFKVIQQLREIHPRVRIIFVADQGSEELAVRALRAGVSDYIKESNRVEELAASVTRLLHRSESCRDESATADEGAGEAMVGSSPPMRAIKSCLARIAAADSNTTI